LVNVVFGIPERLAALSLAALSPRVHIFHG
jgi:hypothetical protein